METKAIRFEIKFTRTALALLLAVVLLLAGLWVVEAVLSQGPDEEDGIAEGNEAGAADSIVSSIVPIQGRLTDDSGNPLDGSYSVRARIYDVSTGGTALCEDTDTVTVDNGLFKMKRGTGFCANRAGEDVCSQN
ncbi:MAG: hypothetical protein ACE5OS_00980 [Anaerolineae bacterium]